MLGASRAAAGPFDDRCLSGTENPLVSCLVASAEYCVQFLISLLICFSFVWLLCTRRGQIDKPTSLSQRLLIHSNIHLISHPTFIKGLFCVHHTDDLQ